MGGVRRFGRKKVKKHGKPQVNKEAVKMAIDRAWNENGVDARKIRKTAKGKAV
jgi:hypothetical protein